MNAREIERAREVIAAQATTRPEDGNIGPKGPTAWEIEHAIVVSTLRAAMRHVERMIAMASHHDDRSILRQRQQSLEILAGLFEEEGRREP